MVQNKEFLPAAKRRKVCDKTPLQLRTYTQDEKLPVFMAAYGSQHQIHMDTLRKKGCLAHFIQDDSVGPRLMHPCEIAMLDGVTSRYLAIKNFRMSWKFLGNQITPLHAMMVLTGAFKIMPDVNRDFNMQDVFRTWESQRLRTSNVMLTHGQAGSLIRHMVYDDDITDIQHANIDTIIRQYGNSMLPDQMYWDLDGFHNMQDDEEAMQNPTKSVSLVTMLDPESPDLNMSPTQSFAVTLRAVLHQAKGNMSFWIASDVPPQDLSNLWMTACEIQSINGECHLFPGPQVLRSLDHNLIVYMADRRLTVYAPKEDNFYEFCCNTFAVENMYDQFGMLTTNTKPSHDTMIMESPVVHGANTHDIMVAIAALQNCTEVFHYQIEDDKWCCQLEGDPVSRQIVASIIATAISKPSLQMMGRYVTIKHDTKTVIEFGAAETGAAAPPTAFITAVAVAFARTMLDTVSTPEGLPVSIKWKSRPLWEGRTDPNVTSEVISTMLMYALAPATHFREVRLVVNGRQFCTGNMLQFAGSGQMIKVHLAFEVCGGAGPTATKTQLRQQVRNSIASWMLENNIELSWINDNLEKLIDDIGMKRCVPVIQQPSSNKRDSQLHQILKEAAIQLPQPTPKVQHAAQVAKNKIRKKHQTMPEPQQFKVDCTYLLKEDGQPTQQLQEFRCNSTGISLTNAQGATPWLRENQQLSSDELAMLILGPMPIETTLPHESVVVPCFNSDTQQVLMQATMVQFGAKLVKPRQWDQTATKSGTSKVCSLTLWKQDWTEDEWRSATNQTTQFVKEVFAHDGIHGAITSVWGRSFRRGKQPAIARDATSVQVHVAVQESQFTAMLKITGHNKIWAVPKNEDGRLTDDFRIIWLPQTVDHPKAATITAKVAGLAGLVRGKSSLEVRVNASMFAEAWKAINPNEKPPVDVSNKWIYKLEPLPYGCNSCMLEESSQHVGWTFRPLRATGPKSWLVCTGENPPVGPLAFNGHPVLPRYMPQKQSPQMQPILAGPRSAPTQPIQQTASAAPVTTPNDPWWNYLNRNAPPAAATAAPSQGPNIAHFGLCHSHR